MYSCLYHLYCYLNCEIVMEILIMYKCHILHGEFYSKCINLTLCITDESTLAEICCQLYDTIVTQKQPPPKMFFALVPTLFNSDIESALCQKKLPERHLSMLHISLGCIRNLYQKEHQNNDLLLKVTKLIDKEIFPHVSKESVQDSLAAQKLWSSYVKQVNIKITLEVANC